MSKISQNISDTYSVTSTLSRFGFFSVNKTMEKSTMGSWALTISTETRVGMVHPGAVEYFGTKGNTARFRQ